MSLIQPLVQTFKLVTEQGYYTAEFKRWIDGVFGRIGGITGGTYTKLTFAASKGVPIGQMPHRLLI